MFLRWLLGLLQRHEPLDMPIRKPDEQRLLFGESRPFAPPSWETKDDRIRGGNSRSCFKIQSNNCATFAGELDGSRLGGAGFASQFTSMETIDSRVSDPLNTFPCNLEDYDGIEIAFATNVNASGAKQESLSSGTTFTFILKDEPPFSKLEPNGRQQAGINWEAKFKLPTVRSDELTNEFGSNSSAQESSPQCRIWLPWASFKATYRGREDKAHKALDTSAIYRLGIMARCFFGEQNGPFCLHLRYIKARRIVNQPAITPS